MKIGLYGVSRSGKNFLIDKVVERTSGIKYVAGSVTLKELARKKFNKEFRNLSDSQKNFIRFEFVKQVVIEEKKSDHHIIVDGHYSFPKKDGYGYDVVFTEADKSLYDIFIYMNTPSEKIVANVNLGETGRENTLYDVDSINEWKEFEITELRKVCRELNKELIVFDGNIECCRDFLCDLVTESEYLLSSNIVRRIIEEHQATLNNYKTVMLIDCDRTITMNDTTYDFCKNAGIDKNILKEIYDGEHYSIYQFYRANKEYEAIVPDSYFYDSCSFAASKAVINEKLLNDIYKKAGTLCVVGITSGIANLWSEIRKKITFPQILIGKGRGKMNGYFVSTTAKYMLAVALKKMGKRVIALGDSMIDIQMLETADNGYIVSGEKINAGVKKYFLINKNDTRIKQLEYCTFKYDEIEEVNSIWE